MNRFEKKDIKDLLVYLASRNSLDPQEHAYFTKRLVAFSEGILPQSDDSTLSVLRDKFHDRNWMSCRINLDDVVSVYGWRSSFGDLVWVEFVGQEECLVICVDKESPPKAVAKLTRGKSCEWLV
jgi:hypothetical protein